MLLKKRKQFLPFSLPSIGSQEISEVVNTLKSGWLTTGKKSQQFENNFADYIGARYAIGLSSCTAALHLALLAHGIGQGDEVIIPSFTFAATANMVVNVGALPVFADILEETLNIDPYDVERKITKKTRAIIPVHYGGQPADLDLLKKITRKHKLVIIEDAAHAVGSEYKGKKIGSLGNTTCFSFYATKNLSTGEGGMLTTNNKKIADFVKVNRLHGLSKDAWNRYTKTGSWQYKVISAGWKYNMFDIQASIGLHQLKKLDSFIKIRKEYARLYDKALREANNVQTLVSKLDIKHSHHQYVILLNNFNRDQLIDILTSYNIGTSVLFIPLHLQPFYKKNFAAKKADLPVTERVASKIVSLPLYPAMNKKDVTYVAAVIKMVLS